MAAYQRRKERLKYSLRTKFPPEFSTVVVVSLNTPHWIRTSNLRFRRPMLYPIELGVRVVRAEMDGLFDA